jgi:hypothetical protein
MTQAPSEHSASFVILRAESPGNVWGFWTEAEALDAVRESIALDGPASVRDWHLVRVPEGDDEASEWGTVAEGDALVPWPPQSKSARRTSAIYRYLRSDLNPPGHPAVRSQNHQRRQTFGPTGHHVYIGPTHPRLPGSQQMA